MAAEQKNRVFVGQLPGDITKEELVQFFSQFGELHDVYLPATSKPRKMAFVTFLDRKCMYAALAQREPRIRGEVMNLQEALPKGPGGTGGGGGGGGGDSSYSGPRQTESSGQGSSRDAKRLFVTNLPTDTSGAELNGFFSQWGPLCDVFYVSPNNYGYVTFEHEEDLRKILRGGRLQLRGTDIKISEAKPRESSRRYSETGGDGGSRRGGDDEDEPNSRLFVKGVPEDASDSDIKAYFATFGEVTAIYKMPPGKTAPTGKATRLMFVTFSKSAEMWKAIAADAHMFQGVQLRVSEAAPKPKNGAPATTRVVEDCRIYVKGVPKEMSDDEVHQYFSNFGVLNQVHRPKKETQGLQFMFVTFSTVQDMARALAHEPHAIGEVPLQVTKARARPENPGRGGGDPWEGQHQGGGFPPATPLLRTPMPPPRPTHPPAMDFATDNPFLPRVEQNYEDYRDPYAAALSAFAQSQGTAQAGGGWGEPARNSYKPDVNRGKIREQRYSPY